MRVAVVGAGVSGLVAAWLLQEQHDVTLFEATGRVGGHAHTARPLGEAGPALDTGFIVFNREDYPLFSRLLDTLGVASQPSRMSFSLHCEKTGFEYCASPNPLALFARRRNLLQPGFYRMLKDILRFYRTAPQWLSAPPELAVDACLQQRGYSRDFSELHLLPMISALWSATLAQARQFPVHNLIEFMQQHGMLRLHGRPAWLSVCGGSQAYVKALSERLRKPPVLAGAVQQVTPEGGRIRVCTEQLDETFDAAVLACHTDQALQMRDKATVVEREVLAAVAYRKNTVTLHTDIRLLPDRRRAWGSWNYRLPREPRAAPLVTYNLNVLQGLADKQTYCVTLNGADRIAPESILGRYDYAHPQFDRRSFAAQQRWGELQGRNGIWYCGAWWGYGFHEDGVRSAVRVARELGVTW